MKRRNEFLVGMSILAALAVLIAGALYLGEADIRGTTRLQTARFRSVGRLQPGSPVLLRGVRVGTVHGVRLADNNWVEAEVRIDRRVEYPERPAIVVVSSSLLGEWQALIVSQDELIADAQLRANIQEAAALGGDVWPGSDLPGIGELTAQANRIANDIGLITTRVEGAIDSSVIADLRATVRDLRAMADRLNEFARDQTSTLGRITTNADAAAADFAEVSEGLRHTVSRVDTATSRGELADIFGNTRDATRNLRDASTDIRELTGALRENRVALVSVLQGLDTLVTRMQSGEGTLGKLTSDSTLYVETAATLGELRALLADIRLNPRKYFRFSVF